MVVNSTFTAGGLSAPIFVCVYGMTYDEMPADAMICLEIPGLYSGSHQNTYSNSVGFLVFVRGNDSRSDTQVNTVDDTIDLEGVNQEYVLHDDEVRYSKESIVAQMYRCKVYHPFVKTIRKDKHLFEGNDEDIPEHLRVISWMDGCASQLKRITSNANMQKEQKLKIIVRKHSAAQTAVEQAADTGAMFKEMKRIINDTHNPHACNSSIHRFLDQTITSMHPSNVNAGSNTPNKILALPSHKKKAILATISKLPIATSKAYSDQTIKKAFILNGQLDVAHNLVTSLNNLLHTYRGNIEGTCLKSKESLIQSLYEDCYTTGIVNDKKFDEINVPKDYALNGDIVNRDVGISQENRQRAKILTSPTQIQERLDLIHQKKMNKYYQLMSLYMAEEKIHSGNIECETKIASLFLAYWNATITNASVNNDNNTPMLNINSSYSAIADRLTYDWVLSCKSSLTKNNLDCFVKARSEPRIRSGKLSYINIPKNKPELFEKLWELHNAVVAFRKYEAPPEVPLQQS